MSKPDEIARAIVYREMGLPANEAARVKGENLKDAIAAALTAEREPKRMCVNCGKVVSANTIKPGDSLPECESEVDGVRLSACTFDLTPEEAWQHWRKIAHDERERASEARKALVREVAVHRMDARAAALREVVDVIQKLPLKSDAVRYGVGYAVGYGQGLEAAEQAICNLIDKEPVSHD